MAKRSPGLTKRGNVWHIDKRVRGRTIRESTGTSDLQTAEDYLARRIRVRGDVARPRRFGEAADRYLEENQHALRSIDTIDSALRRVRPYIDHLELSEICDDSLREFRHDMETRGLAAATINKTLAAVRRILTLSARAWRDQGGPWLTTGVPLLTVARGPPARRPYPLTWGEQRRLMAELPPHLELIALFAVNTGCRAGEITALRWEWEVKVPELDTSVFILPEEFTKNGQERVVVLNTIAQRVIGAICRDRRAVFTFKGRSIAKLSASGWRKARVRAGLSGVRFHDLRHTFGHRLRAMGVSLEDRADLLGHKSGQRMTTHYSAPELGRLIAAVESIVDAKPTTILRAVSNSV